MLSTPVYILENQSCQIFVIQYTTENFKQIFKKLFEIYKKLFKISN